MALEAAPTQLNLKKWRGLILVLKFGKNQNKLNKKQINSDGALHKSHSSLQWSKTGTNILFLSPALFLYLAVVITPFFQGLPYSFTDWNGISSTYKFVGLRNYIRLVGSTDFQLALVNTLLFTAMYVVASNLIGLFIALLVHKRSRLNNVCRLIVFMPYVVSLLTAGFVWKYIFSNVFTPAFGIQSPLALAEWALVGIAIISVWRSSGYCMLIFIAGLQGIPQEYYEAAEIEGANWSAKFRYITTPMLMPAFNSNVLLLIAWGMKVFDTVMATTGGGPGKATITMSIFVYNNIFSFIKAGYGQAGAVLMTLISLVISFVVYKLFSSKEITL
jgi:ABC-type sugar transport system permease subunit